MHARAPVLDESWMAESRGVSPGRQDFKPIASVLTCEEVGLILGTLLGDSAILYAHKRSRFPRISGVHGPKQEEWARYKARRLSKLNWRIRIGKNGGYGDISIRTVTSCHPDLCTIHQLVNAGNGKEVNERWLAAITEEGLAWWHMDDGSLVYTSNTPCVNLHSQGFDFEGNTMLAEWLRNKWEISCKVRHARGGFYLGLDAPSSRRWIAMLGKYSIPSMAYKFRRGPGSSTGADQRSLRFGSRGRA